VQLRVAVARPGIQAGDRLLGVALAAAVEGAQDIFARRERDAQEAIARLDAGSRDGDSELHRRMADALTRVAAEDALEELTAVGLLPEAVARSAVQALSAPVSPAR
jgi:hypothetical protein